MRILFKAWWDLFFPQVPDSKFVLAPEQVRNIIKEQARGNPSLQIGKYVTASTRKETKERIIGHSFIQ